MASRSRHVAPPATLRTHGARPIYRRAPSRNFANDSTKKTGSGSSKAAGDDDGETCVGITIGSVDVMTSPPGTIGTESEMEGLADFIEVTANGRAEGDCRRGRRRRLLPPEIVFPGAFVSARFRGVGGGGDGKTDREAAAEEAAAAAAGDAEVKGGGEGEGGAKDVPQNRCLTITFDARSALGEWAEAHGPLSDGCDGVDGPGGRRGVSILRSVDARLWSERGRGGTPAAAPVAAAAAAAHAPGALKAKKRGSGGGGAGGAGAKDSLASSGIASDMSVASASVASAASAASNTEFRYDWTYSTPYGGTVASSPSFRSSQEVKFNGRNKWRASLKSGVDLTLLSDRTQPILYYDDVNMFEDDLHDNGTSLLNVKVRVMPKCLFVLYRLFVRVDYVMIRVRDVRVYHLFGTGEVWRDVTWRECPWDGLMKAGLPDDVGRWRAEDDSDASVQALMGRVPEVSVPEDLAEHSHLDLVLIDDVTK